MTACLICLLVMCALPLALALTVDSSPAESDPTAYTGSVGVATGATDTSLPST